MCKGKFVLVTDEFYNFRFDGNTRVKNLSKKKLILSLNFKAEIFYSDREIVANIFVKNESRKTEVPCLDVFLQLVVRGRKCFSVPSEICRSLSRLFVERSGVRGLRTSNDQEKSKNHFLPVFSQKYLNTPNLSVIILQIQRKRWRRRRRRGLYLQRRR